MSNPCYPCAWKCRWARYSDSAWKFSPQYSTSAFVAARDQSCPRATFLGPDPAKRWPDPRLPTESLTRPDPTPSIILYFMGSTFKFPRGNNKQFVAWCQGKQWKIFFFRSRNISVLLCSSISNQLNSSSSSIPDNLTWVHDAYNVRYSAWPWIIYANSFWSDKNEYSPLFSVSEETNNFKL